MSDGAANLALPSLLLGISAPNTPVLGYGVLNAALPPWQLSASDQAGALPAYSIVASGAAGTNINAVQRDVDMPAYLLSANGLAGSLGEASTPLPALYLTASGYGGSAGNLSKILNKWAIAASGASGADGSALISLPVLMLSADGGAVSVGTVALTLPAIALLASGHGQDPSTYTAFALNASTAGMTNYDNFQFNSMTVFGGVTLAAGDGGIYAMTGTLDDAAEITQNVKLGMFDFGSDKLKRMDALYFAYRANGDITVRVKLDDNVEHEYILEATGQSGIYTNRLKMGKGMKARYWQIDIEATGVEFVIDSIDPRPQELSRSI